MGSQDTSGFAVEIDLWCFLLSSTSAKMRWEAVTRRDDVTWWDVWRVARWSLRLLIANGGRWTDMCGPEHSFLYRHEYVHWRVSWPRMASGYIIYNYVYFYLWRQSRRKLYGYVFLAKSKTCVLAYENRHVANVFHFKRFLAIDRRIMKKRFFL
jgi:hypothetical protein